MSHLPAHSAFNEAAAAVDVELEYDLLGMALNEPDLAANSAVTSAHFCDFINGMVWDALREGGSLAVVASRLNHIPAFHQMRGIDFLGTLVNKAPTGHQWAQTEARFFETWRLRRVAQLSESLAIDIQSGAGSAAAITRFRNQLDAMQSVGPASSRFAAVNFHDIAPSPQPWLIRGALPMRGVGFVGGATKAGKSFLALDITLRLAAGAPKILGRKAKACGCVYIAAEDPEGCKYRVKAWENRHHRPPQSMTHMPFDLIPQSVNLLDEGCVADLKRALKSAHARFAAHESRLGVIVFDTLSRCLGGADENSSADMGRAFDVLADIARELDALVLVVAHFGKAGADKGLRGHSLLDANSEATITVERSGDDPDLRIVTLAKVKNGVDGQQLAFRLESVGLNLFDDDGEEITSCVPVFEKYIAGAKPRRSRGLRPPEQLVLSAIAYLTDNEQTQPLPADIEGGKPWMKAVTRDQVRARAYASGLAGDEKRNTIRMRLNRALEGLGAAGKIRIENDLMWLI